MLFSSQKSSAIKNIAKLNIDGALTSDSKLMASKLNNYFCNVGADLASKLSSTSSAANFRNYLPPSTSNSFVCQSITPDEVHNLILKLKSKHSVGPDAFNVRLVHHTESAIISPLRFI